MIFALACLLLQAAAPVPAPPAPPQPSSRRRMAPARAKADLASLFRDEDYPAEALRNHESGTSGFWLEIGTDGLVKKCSITSSSGFPSLDGATCRLLTERARFSHAHDRRGRPVTDSTDGQITWRIDPARLPPLEASSLVFTLRSTPAGEATCSSLVDAQPPIAADCPADLKSRIIESARASGRTEKWTEVRIVAPEGGREPIDTVDHGGQFFALDVALSIAPDGSILQCRVARDEGRSALEGAVPPDGCLPYRRGARVFRPLSGATAGRPRSATIKVRGYALRAPPPPPGPGQPARARANLASLFSDEDYPAEAARKGEKGTVGFRLQVGADGLVKGCSVTSSSGSASLDGTTCRLLTERARFAPARDGSGRPVADSVVGRITWRMDESSGLMPFAPGLAVQVTRAFPNGEVTCSVVVDGKPSEPDECLTDDAASLVAQARSSGKAAEQVIVTTLTPAGEAEPAHPEDRGTLYYESQIELGIAPDGSVSECRVVRNEDRRPEADGSPLPGLCEAFPTGETMFQPAVGTTGKRSATMRIRAYTRP